MTYERRRDLKQSEFKRLCGVRPKTFEKMVEVLSPHLNRQGKRGGQSKLSVANQLVITLEYWREYRTYFHIGQSWGLHESTVCRIVRRVEDILIQSGQFKLPGKKQLQQSPSEWKVLVVDVTETPIERPKKNNVATTVGRKSAIR